MITIADKRRAEPSFPLFLSYSVEAIEIESDFTEGDSGVRLTSASGA